MNEYSDTRMLSDGFDSMELGRIGRRDRGKLSEGLVMTIKVCCWEILLTFITNGSTRNERRRI